jgi:hypothetical protein
MNCNATKNDITVTDSVIAPITSILGLFFLLALLLGLLLYSAIEVVVLPLLLSEQAYPIIKQVQKHLTNKLRFVCGNGVG